MSTRLARPARLVAASILLTVTACSKEAPRDPAPAATPAGKHAPAGVEPGSHEDWCAEHEVPESQCTRCNPDLIPAFKATRDWCEAHQLPHSQDKIHNPGLVITRPPRGA